MKLDCVLTAVNDNDMYLDFIPIFVRTWNKLYPHVDVKIILIAHEIPVQFQDYEKNIILFEPVNNVFTGFTSQYIRLLYPCILNYKNGILITDMDILPMNKTYYTSTIFPYDNNNFIYLRDHDTCYKQIAMCYNVATPKTWSEIFEISSVEDIRSRLLTVFEDNNIDDGINKAGWNIDQKHLYTRVLEWNKKTGNYISLKDTETGFNRLDRSNVNIRNERTRSNISQGLYNDYHCLRPMSKYEKTNNEIVDLL